MLTSFVTGLGECVWLYAFVSSPLILSFLVCTPVPATPPGWYRPRKKDDRYVAIEPIPRTAPGSEPRQRPSDQKVEPLEQYQEDHCYQSAEMARIRAELVRPDLSGGEDLAGGYDVESLRVAALARAIQTRLPYLHSCTTNYCLKDW